MKKVLFLSLLLAFTALSALEIYDTNDVKVDIDGRIALMLIGDVQEENFGFEMDAAEVQFDIEFFNKLKFYLSLDPSKPNSSSRSTDSSLLDKAYIQYRFRGKWRMRAGQLKVPFGNEIFYNLSERPHHFHPMISRRLAPGLDRGLSFSARKIGSWLGLDMGVFNGVSVEQSLFSQSLLLPFRIYFSRGLTDIFRLKFGYSVSLRAEMPFNIKGEYRFTDNYFLDLRWKWNKRKRLLVLLEFAERLLFMQLANSERNWDRGVFLMCAMRVGPVEPFINYEYYDERIHLTSTDDRHTAGIGINTFFVDDMLRLRTFYEFTAFLYEMDEPLNHRLAFTLQLDI